MMFYPEIINGYNLFPNLCEIYVALPRSHYFRYFEEGGVFAMNIQIHDIRVTCRFPLIAF